jgi:(S)-2-hydroxyglutarate dehydrogenase
MATTPREAPQRPRPPGSNRPPRAGATARHRRPTLVVVRYVIVGGGILGLATARQLATSTPGAEIVVLERESGLALHQTSHNSGVVHAGLYYAPGSLKARLCRRGIALLREYCAEHGLPYEECGKLVVATEEREVEPLQRLFERAAANGVPGLTWLEAERLTTIEPHVRGVAGLHSPETAIADFAAVAHAFAADVAAAGGEIRTGAAVTRVHRDGRNPSVEVAAGAPIHADRVIVCAGLQADRVAVASGEPAAPRIVPFRGEYWQLRADRLHLVRGLIYPVPDPALPFLGVHLTRKVDGAVVLGPNAVLSTAREAYERRRFDLRDTYDAITWPGTVRMLRRHWRAGVGELARSASRRRFVGEVARYVPAISIEDVVPATAGVRAQAIDRDGTLVDDFRLGVNGNVAWVRNAPSPAATSSLAIAEELLERTS